MRYLFLPFFCLLFFFSFSQSRYEFRGAWIATVDNIDWPTRGNYNPESQRAEFIRILDTLQSVGINAVICQIRPAADAFYPSAYEPWSEWLTGTQGKAPEPLYDPLEFMLTEAHKRGMEFHAWCNPYRAMFSTRSSSIAPTHVTRVHPDWFLTYGTTKYFDPGNKQAQDFVTTVIRDIVTRYDIDALHFDDYFYPYRIPGKDFPDAESYRNSGTNLTLDDWRRSNVDSIILKLSTAIRSASANKKHVRFGISPFGVWRNHDKDPEGSDTKAGTTNYDDLYADILLWMKNDWIDYVAPQIYWEFGHRIVPFDLLTDWWGKHTYGKDCYIGVGLYKAGTNPAWRDRTQLPRMIQNVRSTPNLKGEIYFSAKTFFSNPNGWNDSMRNYYREPYLLPASDSVQANPDSTKAPVMDSLVTTADSASLQAPALQLSKLTRKQQDLLIRDQSGIGVTSAFKLYSFSSEEEVSDTANRESHLFVTLPVKEGETHISIPPFGRHFRILTVIAVDASGHESKPALLRE